MDFVANCLARLLGVAEESGDGGFTDRELPEAIHAGNRRRPLRTQNQGVIHRAGYIAIANVVVLERRSEVDAVSVGTDQSGAGPGQHADVDHQRVSCFVDIDREPIGTIDSDIGQGDSVAAPHGNRCSAGSRGYNHGVARLQGGKGTGGAR